MLRSYFLAFLLFFCFSIYCEAPTATVAVNILCNHYLEFVFFYNSLLHSLMSIFFIKI